MQFSFGTTGVAFRHISEQNCSDYENREMKRVSSRHDLIRAREITGMPDGGTGDFRRSGPDCRSGPSDVDCVHPAEMLRFYVSPLLAAK